MTNSYQFVLELAASSGLKCILIGGHAVNALGYERTTLDLDFMVLADDLEKWKSILTSEGFRLHHEAEAFAQFSSPLHDGFRVDLMLVDASTFSKIDSASLPVEYGAVSARVPCVLHLIALKLHALNNPVRQKLGKDYHDIRALILRHRIDTGSEDFQKIVNRYATEPVRNQLMRDIHER